MQKTLILIFLPVLSGILLTLLLLKPLVITAEAEESRIEKETYDTNETEGVYLEEEAEEYIDIAEIEESLKELTGNSGFSFWDTVKGFLTGAIPLNLDELLAVVSAIFLNEMKRQKLLAIQILLVALASAVFSNFVHVFESHQISNISFYMMYLMISTLLMSSFSSLTELVSETCGALNTFMKILLPSYVITIVLSAGSVTALGFYEIMILAIGLLQTVIIKCILPAIHFYMVVLLLNQLSDEDFFSKLAQLLETAISWGIKSMLGIVVGLQAVQCLVTPAVDSLKNSALTRVASVIPGIGSVLNAAAETVAGSAVVIKNAVGAAGIFALGMICLTPFIKLAVCILLFRGICTVIQPICEKRMVEGIESISRGTVLLLRVMTSSLAIFVISLALITASVKGG
ncbi:MAG: stage III sporulation protein AE [Lachnospiraceae bacterium]|nr:stage III sporulation protein AE [Lachnospiraceae bacterium]